MWPRNLSHFPASQSHRCLPHFASQPVPGGPCTAWRKARLDWQSWVWGATTSQVNPACLQLAFLIHKTFKDPMCSEHVSLFSICNYSIMIMQRAWAKLMEWNLETTHSQPNRHRAPCTDSVYLVSSICPWGLKSVRSSSSECLPCVFPKLLGWIIILAQNSLSLHEKINIESYAM